MRLASASALAVGTTRRSFPCEGNWKAWPGVVGHTVGNSPLLLQNRAWDYKLDRLKDYCCKIAIALRVPTVARDSGAILRGGRKGVLRGHFEEYPTTRNSKICAHTFVRNYCNFAYSALASLRMEMSGSASFHSMRKSWYAARALGISP
jgi:hypothetical protein